MDNNKTLSGLYPFLDKNKKEVNTELLLSSIHKKVADSVKAKQDFFQKNDRKILQAAQMIAKCYQQNGHLFAILVLVQCHLNITHCDLLTVI
jgi:D-sedoheptulose 7-phosphate isomerase